MLNDLHSTPLFSNTRLTILDSSNEQIRNSPPDSSDEISIIPTDSPLITGETTISINRDITSIDNLGNNTTIAAPSIEDARLVSNPTDQIKDK